MARILIVEDEPTIRTVLAELLRDEGHEVHDTDDGAAALAHMATWLPDVALVDQMMPKMTGETFALACQQAPGLAGVPIILMSAARNVLQVAQRVGAAATIMKPFDLDVVLGVVDRLTRAHPPQDVDAPA